MAAGNRAGRMRSLVVSIPSPRGFSPFASTIRKSAQMAVLPLNRP